MKYLEKIYGRQGVLIIAGSGLHWAWFDTLFMSTFFIIKGESSLMPEVATVLVFAFCFPFCLFAIYHSKLAENMIISNKLIIMFSLLGTIGSLMFVASSLLQSYLFVVIGGLLCGVHVAFTQLSWCASYSHKGSKSASPFVAGAFACAVIFDIIPLFMIPIAAAILCSFFPLISGILYYCLDPSYKQYKKSEKSLLLNSEIKLPGPKNKIGISFLLLIALFLMFVSFGHLQHYISFAPFSDLATSAGVFTQMIRGAIAIMLFIFLVIFRWNPGIVYRTGLLIMVGGCLMMASTFNSSISWVSSGLFMSGFTAFNVLIYVVFSQVAYSESKSPIKTIAMMRALTCVGYCLGAIAAVALYVFVGENEKLFPLNEFNILAILLVAAVVLLLSSEDVLLVFGEVRVRVKPFNENESLLPSGLTEYLQGFSLTVREIEITELFIYGRTRTWIADYLCISESTVGTHLRNAYRKLGIHNRQELIDLISPEKSISHKTCEMPCSVIDDE